MRHKFSTAIRRTPVGGWLLDELPVPVRDGCGGHRWTTRRLARVTQVFGMDGEEATTSLQHYTGGDVLDVGAHWGAYCFLLAPKASLGAVFCALEPAKPAYRVLQHNLAALADLYPDLCFVAIPLAAGNGGACKFTFPMGEHYHPRVVSEDATKGSMRTLRVVDIVARFSLRPTFIKVDVEGAEVFVVEGMEETLRTQRPVLMIEMHPQFQPQEDSLESLNQRLEKCGYRKAHTVDCAVSRQELWLPNDTSEIKNL